MTKGSLIALLPPEKGKEVVIRRKQDVKDIMNEVLEAHVEFMPDYDRICRQFAGGSVEKKLYDFCRKNLSYDVESEEVQSTRSPGVLLKMGHCDCKGYAGFIAGILDAMNRAGLGKYDWAYRFAEYEEDETAPGHVFVVVHHPDGGGVWVDPVLNQFNKRDPAPISWEDKKPDMALVRMSGISQPTLVTRLPQKINAHHLAGPLNAYQIGALPAPGFTADQLGIPIAQKVFDKYSGYPGAQAEIARNPPVRFFVGNTQIPLPPPTTYGGQPVPYMPDGLRLVWDSTFMGMPIPADMLNIRVINDTLSVWPYEIASVGNSSNTTIDYLWNTHRYLLFLMLGALENLIYSYSSYAWGNQWDDLSETLNSKRNYPNWLVYPYEKKTFFGNIIQQVAQVEQKIAPILAAGANAVLPGSGAIIQAINPAAAQLAAGGSSQSPNQVIMPDSPTYTDSTITIPNIGNQVVQFAQANPVVSIGIVAAVALAIYELISD